MSPARGSCSANGGTPVSPGVTLVSLSVSRCFLPSELLRRNRCCTVYTGSEKECIEVALSKVLWSIWGGVCTRVIESGAASWVAEALWQVPGQGSGCRRAHGPDGAGPRLCLSYPTLSFVPVPGSLPVLSLSGAYTRAPSAPCLPRYRKAVI